MLRAPLPKALVSEARLGAIYAGGQMGCENSFVAELRSVGVSVYSPPCGQFKLVHEHCSNSRTYSIRGGDGSGQSRIDYKRCVSSPFLSTEAPLPRDDQGIHHTNHLQGTTHLRADSLNGHVGTTSGW